MLFKNCILPEIVISISVPFSKITSSGQFCLHHLAVLIWISSRNLTISKNVPDGEDADTILADLCEETSMEEPGLAYDVFNTWKAAQTSHERESIEGMFLIFAGIEFGEYLERCIKETTQEGEQ